MLLLDIVTLKVQKPSMIYTYLNTFILYESAVSDMVKGTKATWQELQKGSFINLNYAQYLPFLVKPLKH